MHSVSYDRGASAGMVGVGVGGGVQSFKRTLSISFMLMEQGPAIK